MPRLPRELQQAVDDTFALALRIAADRGQRLAPRFQAASVVGVLSFKVTADERMRSDLVDAVSRSTDRPAIAEMLAEASVGRARCDVQCCVATLEVGAPSSRSEWSPWASGLTEPDWDSRAKKQERRSRVESRPLIRQFGAAILSVRT